MPQPKSQQHSLQERRPAAPVRRDTFDGRSENEVIEYKWLQVDPKIKNVFKTFEFFDLLKLIYTLQNHFWIGHFSVATSMSARR